MSQMHTVFMDVLPEGATQPRRVPLTEDRMIIGRGADAGVRLDSQTVSRQHAELFKDPYGRWWVRDLGSRNGTRVNGVKVQEHLLEPTDILQVEDFTLQPRGLGSTTRKRRLGDTTGSVTMGDDNLPNITSLQDIETPKVSASHISVLSKFADELLTIEDATQRLERLCQLMVSEPMHGKSAVVLRISRNPGNTASDAQNVICGPHSSRNWKRGELPYVSRTLLHSARLSNAPVVASNVASDTGVVALSLAGSVMTVAAIACPLSGDDDTVLDLLYITFPAEYGTGEWLALCALAAEQHRHAQASWDARHRAQEQALIETELKRANEIQRRLIPQNVQIPGLNVHIGFEPCKWVGGDYIDALPTPDGKALIFVGDVCGKGLQAALVTASLHTMIHTSVAKELNLAILMDRLNKYLCQMLPDSSFVTAACVLLDPATGKFSYTNAGHPPMLVTNAKGVTRELDTAMNPPLGYLPDPTELRHDKLEHGDILTLYTDGLSEMLHHESQAMLNISGIADMLTKARVACPDDMTAACKNFEQQFDLYQGSRHAQDDKAYLMVSAER